MIKLHSILVRPPSRYTVYATLNFESTISHGSNGVHCPHVLGTLDVLCAKLRHAARCTHTVQKNIVIEVVTDYSIVTAVSTQHFLLTLSIVLVSGQPPMQTGTSCH